MYMSEKFKEAMDWVALVLVAGITIYCIVKIVGLFL
jgi:hypothetical protein